ncbi:dTDP-4-amino-4,6-dideoxygalactose transaminase, partial [Alphaproteobacteria bacterium]|nr:dTDP-4-amino-4,6-dideoxygalactose transaminase [Alphaproteobacteria bacterium]
MKILFNKPAFFLEQKKNLEKVLKIGKLSGTGQYAQKCEKLLAKKIGLIDDQVLLTSSCTHALEMCSSLLNISKGDEVIVPSFTFSTSAQAFTNQGAKIVFADIKKNDLNIDENKIEKLISNKTKAIILVHYAGIPCNLTKIMKLSKKYKINIIEDNAHGLFAKYKGKFLGTFGDFSTTSFHDTKNFSCGEGGALIINNKKYIKKANFIRDKGTDRSLFQKGLVNKYSWVNSGSSYVISELQSSVLYTQLKNHNKIFKRRKFIWDYYKKKLRDWAIKNNVIVPEISPNDQISYHIFYLIIKNKKIRDKLIIYLKNNLIQSSFHYQPLHNTKKGKQVS